MIHRRAGIPTGFRPKAIGWRELVEGLPWITAHTQSNPGLWDTIPLGFNAGMYPRKGETPKGSQSPSFPNWRLGTKLNSNGIPSQSPRLARACRAPTLGPAPEKAPTPTGVVSRMEVVNPKKFACGLPRNRTGQKRQVICRRFVTHTPSKGEGHQAFVFGS